MNSAISKHLNTKQKNYLSLASFTLLAWLIYYFVILGAMTEVKRLRGDIISEKIKIEKNIAREKNMSELSDVVKKIEPQMEKFSQIFINYNRELEFITQLENIAAKNNVKPSLNLLSAEKDSEKTDNFYSKVPISIEASGNFDDLINYIIELESLKYYININKLDISSISSSRSQLLSSPDLPGAQTGNNYTVSMSATTYWK